MTIEIKGIAPDTITGNLKQALNKANWIGETDSAAVALALRLATALDVCFDTGELRDVGVLAQRLTGVLQQLHLTVETRTQGNKEEDTNGEEHRTGYLRLLETAASQPKPKPAKRGANS